MGIERVVAAVNPSMVDFYRGFLFFNKIEETVIDKYDFANGAPAVGLWGDFKELAVKYEEVYGSQADGQNLHKYFLQPCSSAFVFPERKFFKATDPVMSAELFSYFFTEVSDVYQNLSYTEKSIIERFYPYSQYKTVMDFQSISSRISNRFMHHIEANLKGQLIRLKIVDISKNGIGIVGPLPESDKIQISVRISDKKSITIFGKVRWTNTEKSSFGLEIESPTADWRNYIGYLESDFLKLTAAA